MAENQTIESPDFEGIRHEAGYNTEDAIRLMWKVLNEEVNNRRKFVKDAKDKIEGAVKVDAGTTNVNNYDAENSQTVYFTGGSAFNITGIRNGTEGRLIIFVVLGAGTVTLKNNDASSDASNRIICSAGADKAVATNKTFLAHYLNSRWRELVLA